MRSMFFGTPMRLGWQTEKNWNGLNQKGTEMNYKEQQETVTRLRTNRKPLMDLTAWEQDLLRSNPAMVLRLVPSGQWHPMHCDKLDDGRVYCLKADFQLPEPSIEALAGYRIVSMEEQKRRKFPKDCIVRYKFANHRCWIDEIASKEWGMCDGIECAFAVPADYVFAEDRVKQEPKFVDGYALINGVEVPCNVRVNGETK
jgi:hypothetical protein